MKQQTIDPQRSAIMRAVKSKDTVPEMQIRRFVHNLGYRYRLHRGDIPGSPDLTLSRLKCVIFVHGCFWHGHNCQRGKRLPKTNVAYWHTKIEGNTKRDQRNLLALESLGWKPLVIWECELGQNTYRTQRKLAQFLRDRANFER
jgi:DNA mismatch endonuclease (patch repair protein)